MEIKENTNYHGKINLPDNKLEINIIISISKDNGMCFEFSNNLIPRVSYGILTGYFSNKIHFTLINCFQKSYNNDIYIYDLDYMIVGGEFKIKQELVFNRYKFILNDLSKWLDKQFWEIEFPNSINIKEPQYSREILIDENFKIKIGNNFVYSNNFRTFNLSYSGYSYIELVALKNGQGFPIDSVFGYYENLIKFITLISGKFLSTENIYCYIDKRTDANEILDSNDFAIYRNNIDAKAHYFLAEIVYKYCEIEDFLDTIIKCWHRREELRHLIDLNLTYHINSNSSRNTHFLNAFACLEGIDKHTSPAKCKVEERINRYKKYFEKLYPINYNSFLKTSIDTRNFFAHGKKKNNETIFSDFDLLYASKAFIAISKMAILKELDFPEQLLEEEFEHMANLFNGMIKSNKTFQQGLIDISLI